MEPREYPRAFAYALRCRVGANVADVALSVFFLIGESVPKAVLCEFTRSFEVLVRHHPRRH